MGGAFNQTKIPIGDFNFGPQYNNGDVTLNVLGMRGMGMNINPIEGVNSSGVVATFTDDGKVNPTPSDYTATINWGDGTSSAGTVASDGQGGFTVSGSHVYTDEPAGVPGSPPPAYYSSDVTITQDTASLDVKGQATIANFTPSLSNVSATSPISAGQTTTLTGTIVDPSSDGFGMQVDWGDGNVDSYPLLSSGANPFSFTHLYFQPGTYNVALTLTEDDGLSATASPTVVVNSGGGMGPEPRVRLVVPGHHGHHHRVGVKRPHSLLGGPHGKGSGHLRSPHSHSLTTEGPER
jgi:hypothetical protein